VTRRVRHAFLKASLPERIRALVVAEAYDVGANDLGRIADLVRPMASLHRRAETSSGPMSALSEAAGNSPRAPCAR
jgi:hypothetical protein